jgi:hypothetical protein
MKKIIIIAIVLGITLSSCYRGGFGCHGNSRTMTGEGMRKRGVRFN